jgi:hypothetical protein
MVGGFSKSSCMFGKIKAYIEAAGLEAIKPAYA